jgi:hypothetical protein
MKKLLSWQMGLALILIGLSALLYTIHYWLFKDLYHIFYYLLSDLAFLFVNVLIVTLVLQGLLEFRDKQKMMRKLNMVIGTFFIEMGTELIRKFARFDFEPQGLNRPLIITNQWQGQDFEHARKIVKAYSFKAESQRGDLQDLKAYLQSKRPFLLLLLENPNLLEHESFTDLLWAVFHLADELMHRIDLTDLPRTDLAHLTGDLNRAYQQLVIRWLDYMEHLKKDYPYLFSLAVRTNPFDAQAVIEVRS